MPRRRYNYKQAIKEKNIPEQSSSAIIPNSRNNKDLVMKDENQKALDAYYTEAKEIHNQSK
jgi:hypothetical protein